MIKVLSEEFSIVQEWINELRNIQTQSDRMRFRRNLQRIGEIAAYEISKSLPTETVEITTPLSQIMSRKIKVQPVITTILRAGIPLFEGVLNYLDHADCGFVAAYRKHETNEYFSIQQDYLTCPNLDDRPLIIADPMLATGASLLEAMKDLLTHGTPTQIHIVAAIASQKGIQTVLYQYPEVNLWIGALDPDLTHKGYISPGLGDAGDLSYGHKIQS